MNNLLRIYKSNSAKAHFFYAFNSDSELFRKIYEQRLNESRMASKKTKQFRCTNDI